MGFGAPAVAEIPVGAGGHAFVTALQGAITGTWGAHAALPLVVVGEGSDLVPDDVPCVSEVMRPADGDVASAIGMTVAPVTGQADVIYADRAAGRAGALQAARSLAIGRAVVAGADPRRVDVVEIVELPLSNVLDAAIRIRVRASGRRM
jgi:hypothetical protein